MSKPATMNNIKRELASPLVGVADVAECLERDSGMLGDHVCQYHQRQRDHV